MLKWEFTVAGQTLTRTDRLDTYSDMVGQLQASFALDSWWEDYIVIAQFVRDGIPELRVVQNGICDVPDRVLKGAGVVYVSLYAVDAATRKTTNEISIQIEPSGIRRDSLSPSKPSGDVWQQTLDLLGGLQGGQKGQYLQKHSDDNYDFDFADLPTEGTENLYMINDLSNLSKFYTCGSSIEETGDSVFPYELLVWGDIKLGDWDYQTGEFDSYFNTDFGLKKVEVGGSFIPSLNNGDVDIVIASADNSYGANTVKNFFGPDFSGGAYDYHNISSDIEFAAFDCSIMFEHKFKFEFDPENGWDDELITTLLEGKTQNGMGDKLTQIGVRISIPERKDIEVV